MDLEPLEETRETLLAMGGWSGKALMADLTRQGRELQVLVPSLSGLSVSMVEEGLTFTLAATPQHLAVLDGVQYAVGGPYVDAVSRGSVALSRAGDEEMFDEGRWVHFSRVGAAHGVLSTLSMPVHSHGRVVGGVNLYAAAPDAFTGEHEPLAVILGAWAPGAVQNADLSFSTRAEGRRAPAVLEEGRLIHHATGVMVAARGVDPQAARQMIAEAARRAGLAEVGVARALLLPYSGEEDRPGDDSTDSS